MAAAEKAPRTPETACRQRMIAGRWKAPQIKVIDLIDSTSGAQPDQRSLPYGVTTVADPKATQAVIRRSRAQALTVGVQTRIDGMISSGMNRQNVLAEQASMTRAMSLRLNEAIPFTEVV